MRKTKILLSLLIISIFPNFLMAADGEPKNESKKYDYSSVMSKRSSAKKDLDYKQTLCFYPFKAFSNNLMVGYEKQVGSKHVLKVVAGYTSFETQAVTTNSDFELSNYSGLRFDLMLKYFIGSNNSVFNGIYVSPLISMKNSKFKYMDFTSSSFNEWEEGAANSFNLGFVVGYQLAIGENFSLDMYVGESLKKSNGDYLAANRFMDQYKNAIGITSGLSVGFGF